MGVTTGRRNKRTSDSRATQQMALQQPPPVVTTWVKVTTAAQIPNELGLWAARNPQQAANIRHPSIVRTDDGILPQFFRYDANRSYHDSMGL